MLNSEISNKIKITNVKTREFVELDQLDSSGKLTVDIGDTGEFGVNFRGIIEGKEKNFAQNLDHKIILLENHKCPKPGEYIQVKRVSKFVPRGKISE